MSGMKTKAYFFLWIVGGIVASWHLAVLFSGPQDRFVHAAENKKIDLMDAEGSGCPVRKLFGVNEDALVRGRVLYQQYCASCHGLTGAGDGDLSVFLHPKPRDFTKGLFKVRSTASGMPTDEDLYGLLSQGMPGTSMPAFGFLSNQARRHLVEYVKHLSQGEEGGHVVHWFEETPPGSSVPLSRKPEVTPELIATGQRVFRSLDCASCHGPNGEGDGPQASAIKDSWGNRLRPRNLVKEPFIGGDSDEAIYLRVAAGIGGTPMAAYPDERIKPQDRWALVAFIRSLREKAGTLGLGTSASGSELTAVRRSGPLPPSPTDSFWNAIPALSVPLNTVWKMPEPTRRVTMRAAHDGKEIVFLLEWLNPAPAREEGRVQDFVDRAALQFSLTAKPGFLGMGDPLHPVSLWQWRARRTDASKDPKILMTTAYPQKKADLYPGSGNLYYSAAMAGNLLATTPGLIEKAYAHGPGTLLLQTASDQNLAGGGTWSEGKWRVMFRRALVPQNSEDVNLTPGQRVPFALGIWDGHNRDRNGQKNVSSWYFLTIEP